MKSAMIKQICPFCGSEVTRPYEICNGFCKCGAKYYAHEKIWLDRKTGKEVHLPQSNKIVTVVPSESPCECASCGATNTREPNKIITRMFTLSIGKHRIPLCAECVERVQYAIQDAERRYHGTT